jgi:glycosyltransferase involved in cell wall biosynthesis
MKFLFVNNFYYLRGGSERVFYDEIAMLEQKGHQVAPYSRQFDKNLTSPYSAYFSSPISYENVSLLKKVTVAAKLIYSFENRRQAGQLMDDFKPDLIHCHNIYGRITTAILDAARVRNIPIVMTLHDYKLVCPAYLMLREGCVCDQCGGKAFYHCATKSCHKGSLIPSFVYTAEAYMSRILSKYDNVRYYLCPSQFLLEKHAQAGIPRERLVYLPNFLHMEKFTPDYRPGEYILYAGRLSHEKGVTTLLKAMCGLNLPLKIVGDGPLRQELESLARNEGLNHVEFLGYRSGEDLKALFAGAAFLAFPSEWYENAPMTILEAFASGKPVIGSRIGGTPEMVREGKTGLLFEPGDVEDLRRAINQLFSDKSLIIQMGRTARKQVEKENCAESHYQQLSKIYSRARSSCL